MHRAFLLIISLLFLFYGSSASVVRGRVNDAETGEYLVGATIYIPELSRGTITGLDGTFIIKGVPRGEYHLRCSFISYTPFEGEIVVADADIDIAIRLKSISTELDQVVVTAHSEKGSEINVRSTEYKALQVVNVVGARAIELSPDLNMASVLQRMSGVTIDNSSGTGQYALLRGMDKRYNYTLVNGIKIPSTHNKHRYVSLDMFPSEMAERVDVTKALTPNFEGDAIGGVVNMVMRNAPDRFLLQANASAGYSNYIYNHGFLGFDHKVLNPKSPYERNEKGYRAVASDFSTRNLMLQSQSNPLNYFGTVTLGNRFFGDRLGLMLSGSYHAQYGGEKGLYFNDDLSRDGQNLPVLKDMQDRIYYDLRQNTGLHGKLDYRLSPKHGLQLYVAYLGLDKTQVREVQKTDLVVSYDPDQGNINRSHSTRLRFNRQALINGTLQGNHGLAEALSAQWSVAYSRANNRTPEEATVIYGNSLENNQLVRQYVDFDGSTRIWRRNSDEDKAAYLNITIKPDLGRYKPEITVGAMYRAKERTSFYNKYTLNAIVNVVRPDTSYVSFYSEKGKDWDTYDQILWQVYNPRGTVAVGENYDASETVMAGYAMFVMGIGNFDLTGGLRVENTTQGYHMLYPIGEPYPDGEQTYTDFLPSLHVRYKPVRSQNIRLSYYRATNKPGFQEIVPYIDASEEPITAGNKNIKHATAHNIDLRWEYFPDGLDQAMVGLFYKYIESPIEFAFDKFMNVSQQIVYTPINTDKAVNYGIEIDLVKYYREWGVKANYTRTQSSITTSKLSRVKDANGNDSTAYVSQTRPLFGQSANMGNISLLYKGVRNGVSAQLAFAYTGDRIFTVSRYIDNDLWQRGYWQLDISVEKNFRRGLSVFFKAHNLLDSHVRVYIRKANPLNSDVPYHSENDKTTLVRDGYSEPSYLLGFRLKL
jgi:TonB-dependent receptor